MYDDIKLVKSGSVSKVKSLITDTLSNIIINLEFIKNENILCDKLLSELIQEITDIIEWYSKVKSKTGMLDYVRDYQSVDIKFGGIIDALDSTKYYYNLCLVEGRFKVFRI